MRTLRICGLSLAVLPIFIMCAYAAPRSKTPGITISAPASVVVGQVITVAVTPINGATLSGVALLTDRDHGVLIKDAAPWSFTYTIPNDIVGALTVSAMAKDGAGNAAYTASTIVQVGTPATLTSMVLALGTGLNGVPITTLGFSYYGEVLYPTIEGAYSDGITRNLSYPVSGTTFTSENTSVVTIAGDGGIQAVGQGSTNVVAINSSKSLSIGVSVDFVDPNTGSRTGGMGTNTDRALTYSNPVTMVTTVGTTASNILPSSGPIILPTNASQISFPFHNNSGLPQLGVARGLVTWKLAGGSDANCSVSFTNNVLPTDIPPYAVTDGTIIFALPIGGGKCVLNVNIAGLPDNQADKFTITNPSP